MKEQRSFIRRNFSFFPRISNAFGLYLGAAPLWARMSTVLSSLGVLLGAICAFYLVRSSLDVNKLYFLIERSREAWLATPWTHTYARLLAEDAYLSNMIADLQYYVDAASQGDPQAKTYLARNNLTADLVKQSLGSLYQKYSANQDKIAFWLEQNSETLATTAKEQDLRAVLAEQLKEFHADYAKNRLKK